MYQGALDDRRRAGSSNGDLDGSGAICARRPGPVLSCGRAAGWNSRGKCFSELLSLLW
jgi:hypothetical protein